MLSRSTSSPEKPEWAASATARAFGVRFNVRVNEAPLLPALLARLPPGARSCRQPGEGAFCCSVIRDTSPRDDEQVEAWHVHVDGELHAQANREADALDMFESLVRFEVARRAPRWTFVHAGVVGWNGRAILIPGYSFTGKSTLVHALVRAGATYYSDEYAVLDHRGLVYPFAQPLALRRASGGTQRFAAGELGVTPGTRGVPVGMVVSTRYLAGADWNPVRVSPGEGLLALLLNTVRAQAAPARVMRLLARVAESAEMLEGPRGEAESTAADVLSRTAAWQTETLRNIA